MDNLDGVLVVDADGHVNEGDVDLSSRLPERWRSQGPISLKDNQGYPRILGANAVEFFGLRNLPEPNAVKIARPRWKRHELPAVSAAQGALR